MPISDRAIAPDWREETRCRAEGFDRIAGIDEAGRGPWAGPVVAAAVVVPEGVMADFPMGIQDSKKCSPNKRAGLLAELLGDPRWHTGIGVAGAEEIDEINILQATYRAMERAVRMAWAVACLPRKPDFFLVDGKLLPAWAKPGRAVVKGDSISLSIAAASILAKETRDRMMIEEAESSYPGYGFARHKGYGTRQHQEALAQLGPCPIHRKSFAPVRRLLGH